MGIIAGLIGFIFLVIIIALFLFAAIFMARKIGILKTPETTEGDSANSDQHIVKRYVSDLKTISDSLVFRFILIAVLIGFMMIPLSLVSDVVRERSNLYRGVLNDIASTWGQQQNLQGPALFIPYTEKFITEEVKTDKDGYERKVNKTIYKQRTAIVLPDDLNISVKLNGETRKRSLYESLVYTADLNVTGDFLRPDINSLSNHIDKIHWNRSWLALGISDTQAINKVSGLNWNNETSIDFEPGTKVVNTIASGFHAPIDLSPINSSAADTTLKYPFQLNLNINGSQGFYFTPFGKTTDVEIVSDWPHPSFQGSVLPNKHEVDSDGFEATWSVPNLARNYPQLWTLEKQQFNVNEFKAGVNLFESVSLYSQITRAIKYGMLFFTLTYITFLIFEMGIGRRLHIVQYGVIGLALSMFYLTLLSMAEHAGFFNAYISAAGIIIIMISLYAYAAIRNIKRCIIITVLLAGLYTLLYSLLKLEDYALLAGTVLLLVILAVLMVLTSNIGRDTDTGSDDKPDNGNAITTRKPSNKPVDKTGIDGLTDNPTVSAT
ncbi:cell envelope integrity protein CreD [Cocleimonas flava]|uniref:Inner membrane protein n=1 Tax=Cocleimonas flava TaxID=634765 RepID=A0A4R1EYZ3_9GAMM|nr:cell envelope integrity protein CreD [Cocleimonas flava]TCJ87087.1 inner membrane protein [Cocleimonas flava]